MTKPRKDVYIESIFRFQLEYGFKTKELEKAEKVEAYAEKLVTGTGIHFSTRKGGPCWSYYVSLEVENNKDKLTEVANKIVARIKRFKDSKIYE